MCVYLMKKKTLLLLLLLLLLFCFTLHYIPINNFEILFHFHSTSPLLNLILKNVHFMNRDTQ